jgi:hypothetical protein
MNKRIANRNDNQYSSHMEATAKTLPVDTSVFPAHWRHMDDDTRCTSPEQCSRMGRDCYVRGGAPILAE